jgi:hypothetical protein
MWLTKDKNVKLKFYSTYNGIINDLNWGRNYKKDPLNGILDVLRHPTRIKKEIDEGKFRDDCDGHAIYWCTNLVKSDLVGECYFATIQFKDSPMGHAFCFFWDKQGYSYWCDYGEPKEITLNSKRLIHYVSEEYGQEPLILSLTRIKEIKDDGTPVFGKTRIIRP